jgi:hypothetical protein
VLVKYFEKCGGLGFHGDAVGILMDAVEEKEFYY